MKAAEDLRRRIEGLRQSAAFRAYEAVRDHVLRMKELETSAGTESSEPSDYWREELANFDYMLDASPLIIHKLRHHSHHITGLRVYEYRSNRDKAQQQFEEKLNALVALGGKELLVPESPILGGFGFMIGEHLFNVDTLKFYEALIALDRAAVLADFRAATDRKVVWEIGAGWGGFAYQFKSLCPNVTYVITDFAELFLFSAVYLLTAFPDARVLIYEGDASDQMRKLWREFDFIFVPHFHLDDFVLERVDLTLNMVSFQEMTESQVESYVRKAFDLRCPYLYSLNRERSPYNPQLTSVTAIIDRFYWSHEVPVLPVSYTKMLKGDPEAGKEKKKKKLGKSDHKADAGYKHVVGWRRVKT